VLSCSRGCGVLINGWLADRVAVARVEAICCVVLPVPLHFTVAAGTESGLFVVFLVFFVVVTFWQVICSMMTRSFVVLSKTWPTLKARIILSG